MSADLNQRRQEIEAEALRVNAGRKPKFGDLMRNPWAGEGNPTRDGYFVRSKTVTGRFNPGLWYEMTDRDGKFWETNGKSAMFVDEHQQRATDQAAHDIGMAHIICNQAGIPQGEIIGRLVALSGKGDAAGWISVERQLPGQQGQDSEEVLCFLSGHCALTDMECRQGAGWGIRLGWYDAGKGMFRTHGKLDASVTHWMPLPATPQTAPSQAKSEGDAT